MHERAGVGAPHDHGHDGLWRSLPSVRAPVSQWRGIVILLVSRLRDAYFKRRIHSRWTTASKRTFIARGPWACSPMAR